ncbi:hypothetical protein ACFL6S_01275 [Candidatus Poribacteria bacterium]
MSKEKAISPEELGEVGKETDESDRRAFLKTAAKAAGAVAMLSVAGALVDDEVTASEPFIRPVTPMVRNMRMDIARGSKSKQLSFSGKGLGKALQEQGLIPSDVKNLDKASIEISLKW